MRFSMRYITTIYNNLQEIVRYEIDLVHKELEEEWERVKIDWNTTRLFFKRKKGL